MNNAGFIDRTILKAETITVIVMVAALLFVSIFVIFLFSQGVFSEIGNLVFAMKTLFALIVATGFASVWMMNHLFSKLSKKHGILDGPSKLDRVLLNGLKESRLRNLAVSFGLSMIALGAFFGAFTGLAFSFYAITNK